MSARRQVWLPEAGGFVDCPLYDRERLGPGHALHGPAIVEQMDSTTLVLPGQTATVDPLPQPDPRGMTMSQALNAQLRNATEGAPRPTRSRSR